MKQLLSPLPLLLIFFSLPIALAQSPAQAPLAQPPAQTVASPPQPLPLSPPQSPLAQPPAAASPPLPLPPPQAPGKAPSGPPDVTAILEKAHHFDTLVRLLKTTQQDNYIAKKLNDSSQSLTIFAPDDNAFGKLSSGTLNSYNDQKKIQLIKFHMISSFLSIPGGFQTASNPMSTEAGSSVDYPLNVTTTGNLVNLTSGVVNTSISGTVYADNQLAIYRVDRVLLPLYFFQSHSPAPAPSRPARKKAPMAPSVSTTASDNDGQDNNDSVQPSAAVCLNHPLAEISFASSLIAILSFLL
ncbi:hypothetical protein NMG60_11000530 [Bertholletia excelsa]